MVATAQVLIVLLFRLTLLTVVQTFDVQLLIFVFRIRFCVLQFVAKWLLSFVFSILCIFHDFQFLAVKTSVCTLSPKFSKNIFYSLLPFLPRKCVLIFVDLKFFTLHGVSALAQDREAFLTSAPASLLLYVVVTL